MSYVSLDELDLSKVTLGNPIKRFKVNDDGSKQPYQHYPIKYEYADSTVGKFYLSLPAVHAYGIRRPLSGQGYVFNLKLVPEGPPPQEVEEQPEVVSKLQALEQRLQELMSEQGVETELKLVKFSGENTPFTPLKLICNGQGRILSQFYKLGQLSTSGQPIPLDPQKILNQQGQCEPLILYDLIYHQSDTDKEVVSCVGKLYEADFEPKETKLVSLRKR